MFYDDAFANITENSPFSEAATMVIGNVKHSLKGFFYSGNHGEKKLDKGYTTAKTVKRQAFQISKSSLPLGVGVADLARKTLTVRGTDYIVRDVTGNDSGMLIMELVPSGGDKT